MSGITKHKKTKLTPPLRWFGGKAWLGREIDKYTPPHKTYVEVFSGGAHVFWKKKPSEVEVLNDYESNLVNFYRVLRDKDLFGQFKKMIELTPYSREIFRECSKKKYHRDPVVRAWSFYVAHGQGRDGFPNVWSLAIDTSSRNMSATVSRWLGSIDGLLGIHERLQGVQLENNHFSRIIKTYDRESTWFYCDPPYVHDTRIKGTYDVEMSDEEHLWLVDLLLDMKGMCLLSGYNNEIYKPLEVVGWRRQDLKIYSPISKKEKIESLWFSPHLLRALWDEGKCLDLKDE